MSVTHVTPKRGRLPPGYAQALAEIRGSLPQLVERKGSLDVVRFMGPDGILYGLFVNGSFRTSAATQPRLVVSRDGQRIAAVMLGYDPDVSDGPEHYIWLDNKPLGPFQAIVSGPIFSADARKMGFIKAVADYSTGTAVAKHTLVVIGPDLEQEETPSTLLTNEELRHVLG